MTQYCHHHPTIAAHWYCPKCDVSFCPECIQKREKASLAGGSTQLHLCPRCMAPADWIGAANLIEPFWRRIPKIFSYPFKLRVIILMAVLAFASTLFSSPGFFNGLIGLLLWGVLLKYAYAALKSTAKGDLQPPPIDNKTISEDFTQVFKQLGLFFAIVAAFPFILAKLGVIVAILYVILIVFSLPAMIIILVTTDRFLHAVNPMLFVNLALRIGWGYFLMYFFLILLAGAPALLAQYAIQLFPPKATLFIFSLAKNYYTVISYHLMGYVILQYHREIGYTIDFEDFRYDAPTPQESDNPSQSQDKTAENVNFLMKEGKHDEALEMLREKKSQSGIEDLNASEYYYNLLKLKKEKVEQLAHAPDLLKQLTAAGHKEKACDVYRECVSADPGFMLDARLLFKVGGWLNEQEKAREAIGTYNRLIKTFPSDPLVPKALYRCARIYRDQLENPQKAGQILTVILKKYPNDDFVPQIKNDLKQMKSA